MGRPCAKFNLCIRIGASGISALAFFGSGPAIAMLSNYELGAADPGRKIVESPPKFRVMGNSK